MNFFRAVGNAGITAAALAVGDASRSLNAQESQTAKTTQSEMSRLMRETSGSVKQLVLALDHPDFHTRAGAEAALFQLGLHDIQAHRRPFGGKLQQLKGTGESLERQRRLENITTRLPFHHVLTESSQATILQLPEEWKKPGARRTIQEILEHLVAASRLNLTTQYAGLDLLSEPIETAKLDGKSFWEVIDRLKTQDGRRVKIVHSPVSGVMVDAGSRLEQSVPTALSGPFRCRLYESQLGKHFSVDTEPKLLLHRLNIKSVTVVDNADAYQELEVTYGLSWGSPKPMINRPKSIIVRAEIFVYANRSVEVPVISPQSIDYQSSRGVQYLGTQYDKESDSWLSEASFSNWADGQRLTCVSIQKNGTAVLPVGVFRDHQMKILWKFPSEPTGHLRFTAPDMTLLPVEKTFVFTDLQQ